MEPPCPELSRGGAGSPGARRGRREKILPTSVGSGASRAAAEERRGREVQVGDEVVYVTETGSGLPAVLLPSMLIRGYSYGPTVEAMARRCRVVVVELPGSGRGSRLRAPWTLERYARSIADVLEVLRLDQVTLIGHSLSGAAALVGGALFPERLSRLVLVDAVGVNPPRSILALLLKRMADMRLEPRFTRRSAPAFFHNVLVHTRNAWSLVRIAATAELGGYAARVRVPTLLAWGARDHTVPVGSALALQRLIPGSTLYVSAKGSHDWIVERPAEFAEVLSRFMYGSG